MESNRSEAERCLEIGHECERDGNLERALKFFLKSQHLYPSQAAKEATTKIHHLMNKNKNTKPNVQEETTKHQENKVYTQEQKELVDRFFHKVVLLLTLKKSSSSKRLLSNFEC